MWAGPKKTSAARVFSDDASAMWALARAEWALRRSDLEGVLMHDGWTDKWKRDYVGGMLSYLADNGEPRMLLVCVQPLIPYATAEDTPKSANAMRDALVSNWNQHMCPDQRLLDALDLAPPLVESDNTGSAVKVGSIMGGRPSCRCLAHILFIHPKRLCFSNHPDTRLKAPRPPHEKDLFPQLLVPLELLRAWAACMSDQAVFQDWQRLGHGGSHHAVLHLDSPTDWNSTLALCERAVKYKALGGGYGNRLTYCRPPRGARYNNTIDYNCMSSDQTSICLSTPQRSRNNIKNSTRTI